MWNGWGKLEGRLYYITLWNFSTNKQLVYPICVYGCKVREGDSHTNTEKEKEWKRIWKKGNINKEEKKGRNQREIWKKIWKRIRKNERKRIRKGEDTKERG